MTGSASRPFAPPLQAMPLTACSADPSMHGEISGLHRCTQVLTERGLSPSEILAAWRSFSLYTTGEPCPMVRLRSAWVCAASNINFCSVHLLCAGLEWVR